jgi:NitT/TauT family transport system ATP-binding protein
MIRYEGVTKRFSRDGKAVVAVTDVSFVVGAGEFVAVVGPSGCGKSTLLNMAAGLMRPSEGRVSYRGEQVRDVNRNVGFVTQRDNLLPWRSVFDNVGLALEIQRVPKKVRRERVKETIELVGLAGFEDHYPAELSGGMRKRVTLARTLIYRPETVLMDEPFGELDAQLKLILQDELLRLWDRNNMSIVFVTHDLNEAVALADRVIVMSARPGQIKEVISTDLPRPRDVFEIKFDDRFKEVSEAVWQAIHEDMMRGTEV